MSYWTLVTFSHSVCLKLWFCVQNNLISRAFRLLSSLSVISRNLNTLALFLFLCPSCCCFYQCSFSFCSPNGYHIDSSGSESANHILHEHTYNINSQYSSSIMHKLTSLCTHWHAGNGMAFFAFVMSCCTMLSKWPLFANGDTWFVLLGDSGLDRLTLCILACWFLLKVSVDVCYGLWLYCRQTARP